MSDLASIVGEDVTPVEKQFVFDFADLGIPLDNIEGITFGPDLPDGRKTLVVVSDNNFSDAQTTLFIALSISGDLDVQSVELVDIESVVGTAFADEIIGSDDDNTIDAGAGDDVILASGGDDAVEGGEGDDRIVFDGVAGAFMISRDGEGNATVEGSDGTTTTTGVETLVFDNLEVDLTADPVDASGEVELSVLGTFATGIFDEGAQEIPAFDPETARLFVTNGDANTIDVLDISDPTTPTLAFTIDVGALAAEIPGADGVNSVAVANGIVAAAIANEDDTAPGFVAFFDADGVLQGSVEVGVLPDAVTFTPDGTKLVVANEGEPDGDVNPLGSISIITLADDLSASNVTTLDFTGFEDQKDALAEAGVLFQPGATLAESLEPEFAAVSPDGTTAFVNLQENNAFAIVDLATETITEIVPLGTVDHSAPFAGLDVSEEDGGINIVPQPLQGLFQPDGIAAYTGPDGRTFYVTANEGDAFPGDDENLEDLTLDPDAFPDAAALQDEAALGDLEVSAIAGDTDGDGDLDELFSFGGRSFSIWDEAGTLVFNSGDMFEQITAAEFPEFFNADNDDNDLDSRSPDAGPEPEGVAVGVIDGQTYAFIGLERIGGIVVYNVTDPVQPSFVQYINNRDFTVEPGAEEGDPLDLGPEGLVFISAEDSPTGQPLLAVANEVSGTTTIYGIDLPDVSEPPAVAINEIRIDQPGEDVSEFFELAGEAGTSLDGLTYVVLGDGAGGSGTVETAVDLSGLTLGEDGLFLAVETAESFVSPSVPDLVTALNFENSDNVTHLLVEGFSGTDDADADDDGVLDDGFGTVIDSVALIETPGEGDNTFSDVTVGPDGPFVPGQVFRETDVTGDFAIGEFTFGVDDTPGLPNEGFVADGTLPNGVASGDVTAGAAVLWARAADAGTVTFEVSTTADFTDIVETVEVEVDDPLVPAKTKVEGLDADTEYFYRATDADGATSAGRFATAAAAGTTAGLTFGVSGDWRGELSPYPAVSNVAEAELDFFLLHGDTIYADFASPSVPAEQATTLDEYLVKHEEVYSERLGENYWAEVRASTSVFATIDDHEVTNDFAGGATVEEQATEIDDVDFGGAPGTLINDSPLYDTGLDAFQAYNPIEDLFFDAPGNELFDGERMLFRSQRYGDDAQFIVLDQRSFRDIQLEAPDVSDFSTIPPFLAASLAEDRTLLGDVQFDMLKTELLAAEEAGVTWKFVSTPEPIQNIGLNSPDAWEGYANERAELLAFIEDEDIDNVVFIAADVHATFVNNLTYQDPDDPLGIAGPQLSSSAFEVTTGSVAFEPPTGEAILLFAAGAGLFSDEQLALLETLPVAPDADDIIDDRDDFLTAALEDLVLNPFGLDPLGLEDNLPGAEGLFDVELLAGDYVTAFNFGWTEFDVDPETQALTVTTFGVPPYVQADLAEDPEAILALEPQIVSQFVVNPQGDDDDGPTTIADVQGAGHISPLLGETVTVAGIVTAVDSNGFYVQDPVGDGDDATSDAIFVFTSDAPTVAVGDAVSLTGEVSEFIPGGAGTGNLSTTQFAFPDITVLSSGNDLPEAVVLGAAGRTPPTDVVISDSEAPVEGAINLQDVPGTFNPDVDGIDFYESLEGMRVTIDDPVTVSATNVFGETWTVVDDGANVTGGSPDGGLNERGGINLNADVDGFGDLNPERVQIQFDSGILPDFDLDLTIGADLSDVTGVVGYSFGNFEVLATEAFEVETPSPLTQEVTELVGTDDQLSVVTYNVLNVTSATGTGDSGDDDAEQIAALADQFVFNLGSPDIIALQEIQDDGGEADGADDGILSADETLTAIVDAISAAGGPEYQFASAIVDVAGETGGVPGGNIRNAYLWNPERVTASEITTLEVEELTELGVTEPTTFDGTRDPLLGVFEFGGEEVTLINNHLSSRFGSDPIFGGPQLFEQGGEAAREAETLALNEVVDALLADDPDADIVVLGDLNTFEFTDELTEDLPGVGDDRVLSNLITETLTGDDAYTFVFQGNSQVLDHIFVTDGLLDTAEVDIVHVNTDFPDFASDHEPVIALLTLSGEGDTPLA
ncbi:MAG: choice-of-anchor I family protein [Pseudomonadota bacterium]